MFNAAVNFTCVADPTYMIRAIPSIASDNVYCTLLAHSAIHGAMAGYTGFTVGPVNGRHAYIPFYVSSSHIAIFSYSCSASFLVGLKRQPIYRRMFITPLLIMEL